MDRKMIYPGQIPLETDMLDTNRFALIGLGKLAAAVLGTSTLVNGLACTPTAPASMQVQVAPGEIYSLQNLDGTAYSSLAADTTHQILKQGLMMDAATLSCPAPATSGQSINYLVQVTYQDTDANAVVLPYYNASNPTQAYTGPNNSGTAQNTVRKGVCTVSVKAGIAATTGTQQTPAADSGYIGLFVVTVAYGQTSITAGNISTASGAPFINSTLLGLAPAFTAIPTSPTPSQFDNSTKSATTAFVQRALGNIQGLTVTSATPYNMTTAQLGSAIYFGAGSSVFNLPNMSGMPVGSMVYLSANVTTTVNGYTGQLIDNRSNGGAASISMAPQDDLFLAWTGGGWLAVGGSYVLRAGSGTSGALFGASKFAQGYQKLPSGIIIQWGMQSISTGNGDSVTFPIAFPNAVLTIYATDYGPGCNPCACVNNGTTSFLAYAKTSGTTSYAPGTAYRWLAIGY